MRLSLVVRAAVALVAAATLPVSFAWAETVQVEYDGQLIPVEVDGDYWGEHPSQRGLQGVVASERLRNDAQDVQLADHERRIGGLEASPQLNAPPPGGASPGTTSGVTPPPEENEMLGALVGAGVVAVLAVLGLIAYGVLRGNPQDGVGNLAQLANTAAQQANQDQRVRVSGYGERGGAYALTIDRQYAAPAAPAQAAAPAPAPRPAAPAPAAPVAPAAQPPAGGQPAAGQPARRRGTP